MAGQTPVKLSDIAAAANTSIATVSLALSGNPRISDKTRSRILALSKTMGYRPRRGFRSDAARRAATAQDRLRFGFLAIGRLDDPINAVRLQAASDVTSERRVSLELLSVPVDTNERELVARAIDFGRRLDGLIVIGAITLSQLKQIEQAGIPSVLYGYPLGLPDDEDVPVPIVSSDWISMGHRATRALIETGHKRIAFLSRALLPNMWHARCFDGYASALLHAGKAMDRSLVFVEKSGDMHWPDGVAAKCLKLKNPPTGYVAINPGTAARFLAEARVCGLEVARKNIVICGYRHQMKECGLDGYPLVYMDPEKIVAAAITQLHAKCLHQSGGNFTVLVPFSSQDLPAATSPQAKP